MPSQPIASWTTPCSSRNVMESGTRTRRQIIGLIPSSRTLSRTIAPGSAADFTDSMTENCALPRDSIKIDPTEFCASQAGVCSGRRRSRRAWRAARNKRSFFLDRRTMPDADANADPDISRPRLIRDRDRTFLEEDRRKIRHARPRSQPERHRHPRAEGQSLACISTRMLGLVILLYGLPSRTGA